MSERKTLKQKAKRTCLIVLQYVFAAIAVVSIFAISIYISMPFYGYKTEVVGTGILLMAAAMLVSLFFVTIAEKELRRIDPRYEGFDASYRGNLKIMAFTMVGLLGIIASSSVLNAYFGLLPATISKTLRVEIFKTVIQADGFLIGLSGIVFAQMFWAINHQQGNIQVELLKERKQGETLERDVRTDFVRVLDRKRTRMAMKMFLVVGIFAISVALSLSGMARTDLYATDLTPTSPDVVNPLGLMFLGITVFVISIATSKMSLEEDIEKFKTKTPQASSQCSAVPTPNLFLGAAYKLAFLPLPKAALSPSNHVSVGSSHDQNTTSSATATSSVAAAAVKFTPTNQPTDVAEKL